MLISLVDEEMSDNNEEATEIPKEILMCYENLSLTERNKIKTLEQQSGITLEKIMNDLSSSNKHFKVLFDNFNVTQK